MIRLSDEQRAERRAFLERRQQGIGGSDLPVILGLVPKKNALDIMYQKTRPIRDSQVEELTIHQWRGLEFEEMALTHYWAKTGRKGRRASGPVSDPDFPRVVVSPDFEIFADPEREEPFRGTGVGETKSPGSAIFRRVYESGLRDSELVQLQTNIAAARRSWGSLNFFNTEHDAGPTIVVDQEADEEMGRFLLEVGQRFWDECVAPRVAPDPDEWRLLARSDAPEIVELSGEVQKLEREGPFASKVGLLLDAKDLRKEAADDYDRLKDEVFSALVGRGIGKARIPGAARLTVVTKKGTESFDRGRLREHRPLDRDKVEKWLRERFRPPNGLVGDTLTFPTMEDIGRMLFETELDLDAFVNVGEPSQFLLPNRTTSED